MCDVLAQSRMSWKDRQWHGKPDSETFRKEGDNNDMALFKVCRAKNAPLGTKKKKYNLEIVAEDLVKNLSDTRKPI